MESATAAGLSERNTAQSAVQAAQSATAAAQSASDAQQAVDGFGLQVGTTTTGDPGSDAAVEIQKTGTKYTANFTIPRGDKGEQASVEHDATLTGDGTLSNPLAIAANQVFATADESITDANNMIAPGCYGVGYNSTNVPGAPNARGQIIVPKNATSNTIPQVMFSSFGDKTGIFFRKYQNNTWSKWEQVAYKSDVPSLSRTMADPESQGWHAIDFNDFTETGVYTFNGAPTNSPRGDDQWISGTLIVSHSLQIIMQLCAYHPFMVGKGLAFRLGTFKDLSNINWNNWYMIASTDDLPDKSSLANVTRDIASLSTRVQALEARIKSLETNQ